MTTVFFFFQVLRGRGLIIFYIKLQISSLSDGSVCTLEISNLIPDCFVAVLLIGPVQWENFVKIMFCSIFQDNFEQNWWDASQVAAEVLPPLMVPYAGSSFNE